MSLPVHPLLALVDVSKNYLKCSLTSYIDFTVENQFGQLRNTIEKMIESGEIVSNLGDVNLRGSTQANTTQANSGNQPCLLISNNIADKITSEQITLPSESLVNTINTTSPLIKQECPEYSSTTIPINVARSDAPNDDDNDESNNVGISSLNKDQNEKALIDAKDEYDDDDDDDEDIADEGEYFSECEECEDCVKGICGLVRDNDNADAGVDTEIGLNQNDQTNASGVSDLLVISDVIDGSNQSAGNSKDLSLINESEKKLKTVQYYKNVQSSQPVKERSKKSIPFTSAQRSPKRKQIPQNVAGDDNSNEDVKKAKFENGDEIHQEEETKLQIVTLELNCTEPGCKSISKSHQMWKQHLSSCHGLVPYKQLEDNVRHNQQGQTEYLCTDCNVMHKQQIALYRHWRNYHQAGKFQCSDCAFVANFRGEVYSHQLKTHRPKKFQCTNQGCNKVFRSKLNLEQHERIHNGERPFKCIWDNCEASFNQIGNAILHVRMNHFRLPSTLKMQKELNISDDRDPKVYVQVMLGD